ncbi:MAG: hypothetical protein HKN16_08680 [Saprospiraceae bacterium]|nr:hypothetical protein [Saprospiraceae bacterium]
MIRNHILLIILFATSWQLVAQEDQAKWGTHYKAIEERILAETKWRYTYAMHLESNTIIHQAEDFYEYYIHFKYNYVIEQYLNGRMTRGPWSVDGSMLNYSFKRVDRFEVAKLDKQTLVLEFKQPNSKGTYQYHFVRVDSKDAPFVKPANELPDIIVEKMRPAERRRRLAARRKKKKDRKKSASSLPYISIELIGGGYYGGIDPVLRDYIHIKSSGRLVKEFKSRNGGLIVTKKDIPRQELEEFADYITRQKFFNMERIYDCNSSSCQTRKQKKPTPIPLRLAVAYGNKKKVVTIAIWGGDKYQDQYVDYPKPLDYIIEAIQKMAHRLDDDKALSKL